jgi:prevent-host-death family protein
MTQTVSTLEIRERLGDILNRVALRHDQFIIERKGKPLAAMIPVDKLRQIERLARTELLDAISTGRPRMSQRQAEVLASEAKHRSRKRGAR